MADSSLDDFFAKKDKSKKPKKKYSTPEEIAKQLEESGKQTETKTKKEKEKPSPVTTATTLKILEQDNEEWKDFEDEREKDYSGLRIQALNLKDKEEELRDQKLQENGQESKRDEVAGPWKVAKPPSPVPESESIVDVVTIKEEKANESAKETKYVPPHLRNKGNANAGTSAVEPVVAPKRGFRTSAPQINNESEFPSLGANDLANDGKAEFQNVRHGSKDMPSQSSQPLHLGNKYHVLSNDKSEESSDQFYM